MSPQAQRFSTPQALAEALAGRIAAELSRAIEARGKASLVVSGGRTPLALFEQLRQQPLPWSAVWITLADERWVPPDSPDSNEGLVRQGLLQGPASEAHFVGLWNPAPTPEAGQAACAKALEALPRPFEVVVLGMGDDGHTASLFPKAPQLAAALDLEGQALCLPIDPVTAPHPRMTLTLPALLASRWIVLHLVGETKWQVYQQASTPGPVNELPVRAVLQQTKVPIDVYWSP